jgi:[citrate (pro-3S)-lyase] ligase
MEQKILLERRSQFYYRNPDRHGELGIYYDDLGYSLEEALDVYDAERSGMRTVLKNGVTLLADVRSRFYNVTDGMRFTTDAPERYRNRVYVFGHCGAVGARAEDKNTIASYLQRAINHKFPNTIKVLNCANWNHFDCSARQMITSLYIFSKNDIVILLANDYDPNIANAVLKKFLRIDFLTYLDYSSIFNFPHRDGLLFDDTHTAHRGYKVIAERLFSDIKNKIAKNLENHIHFESLDSIDYFYKIKEETHNFCGNIGAIVMNANPFTNGHKYLIKKALSICEYIYIFILDEDKSFFSANDRFLMAQYGTKDLKNIYIAHSTKMILSSELFPEYFDKSEINDITVDASQDIDIFINTIAPLLEIKFRFVGTEPLDNITRQYNDALRARLPQSGINFIEIERMQHNGCYISASHVRKLYRAKMFGDLSAIVPESTLNFLRNHMSKNNMITHNSPPPP